MRREARNRLKATGVAGASGGQFRGADAASPSGRGRFVEAIVFRFCARVSRVLPRRLRLAAGDRFSQRRGLQPPGAVDHTLLVATTRERDDRPGTLFNGDRATATDYAEITVSIPPNHKQGEIEWASTPPGDPNVDFVVRDEKYLDGDKAFVQALNAQLALRPPGSRNVFLFIHGFNTMFAEAVYRLAQLAHDLKAPGVPVLFTWASRGKADSLCLRPQQRDRRPRRPRAHAASAASQQRRKGQCARPFHGQLGHRRSVPADQDFGRPQSRNKIGNVFLAAPDIDIDVFKSQMRRFGKPRKPFYIILSTDDRALFLSRTIAGGVTRVGDNPDVAELASLGATVIDLTDLKATDATNHDKFAQLATVAPELRGVLARGIPKDHQASDVGQTTVSGVGSVVSLPLTMLGAPIRIIAGQ